MTASRRAVLIGAAAVTALPAKAIASSRLDGELDPLFGEIRKLHSWMTAAWEQVDRVHNSYNQPPRPNIQPPNEADAIAWKTITHGEFSSLPEGHTLKVWVRETEAERTAAQMAWNAEAERLERLHGADVAEAEAERLTEEVAKMGGRIMAVRAKTVRGLYIKLQTIELMEIENDCADEWASIAADISAMNAAGAHGGVA